MYIDQSVFHLYGWITLFRLTEYISPLWVDNSFRLFSHKAYLTHKGLLLTLDTSI